MLEAQFAETVESHPELLAHHYSLSGEHAENAVQCWGRAADRALSRSANVEAVSHLSAALEDLAALEGSTVRDERELELRTKLGPAVVATRGFADPLVRECYARAQALCEALGDSTKLALILRGQQVNEIVGGDVETARLLAGQLAAVAEQHGDVALRVGGHQALAQANISTGRLAEGLEHAERGMALFDPAAHHIENWPGGQPGEQRWVEAELHRQRSQLLLASTPIRTNDAEASLELALKVARAQGARSIELRALESLVSLRSGREDELEARTMLAACYGQFTEGLDTADLCRAKALLESDRAVAS